MFFKTETKATCLYNERMLGLLRLLENDIPIHVMVTKHKSIGVDRPEDIEKVSKIIKSERE